MTQEDQDPGRETSLHARRAVGGDTESLAWLVRRLSPLLIAQAEYRLRGRLRRHCEPEDLVNDAWLVLIPRILELRERHGRLTPVLLRFLSTALLHRINNLVRKHLRHGATESAATAEGQEASIPAEDSGVVTRAIREERQGTVRSCLRELNEMDREVIVLRGIEQQDNRTVAVILDQKPHTVAMRYRRALQRLRDKLPGSVFDEL